MFRRAAAPLPIAHQPAPRVADDLGLLVLLDDRLAAGVKQRRAADDRVKIRIDGLPRRLPIAAEPLAVPPLDGFPPVRVLPRHAVMLAALEQPGDAFAAGQP